MKKNNLKNSAESVNDEVLAEILSQITPEQQRLTDRKMQLAARIFDAMKQKGWNQKQLALALKKDQSEISRWLSGTHNFNAATLWAIGDVLDIDLLPVLDQKVVEVKYETIVLPVKVSSGIKGLGYAAELVSSEGSGFYRRILIGN